MTKNFKEFSTPSGNHRKIYQFTLNPPLRARYILLGITEYEKNPCLRFDMHGCLAPLSTTHEVPAHLQVISPFLSLSNPSLSHFRLAGMQVSLNA